MLLETELFHTCRLLRANDPTLTIVNLCQRSIDNDGAMLLSEALQHSTHVVVLILSGNMIRDRGAIFLANALVLPSSVLQYLHLGSNLIGAEGVAALSQLTQLKVLDLHCNSIGCEGAAHLATLLDTPSSCLQSLVLKGNDIREQGLKRLAHALRDNESLQSLDLSENTSCSSGAAAACKEFKDVFLVNTTLQTISLGDGRHQELLDLYHLGRAFLQDSGAVVPIAAFFSKASKEPNLLHLVVRGRPEMFISAG